MPKRLAMPSSTATKTPEKLPRKAVYRSVSLSCSSGGCPPCLPRRLPRASSAKTSDTCAGGRGWVPALCAVTGEPVKQPAKMTGEPVKRRVNRALCEAPGSPDVLP